jgi:hypothetical protein
MTTKNDEDAMGSATSYEQIISNQEAFLKVRKMELNRIRGVPTEDEKTDLVSEVSSNFGFLELGSTYAWSGSGSESASSSSSSLLPSPPRSDFHESIEAIREEAARIDTIMALDQLDTIKQELGSVKKVLKERRLEIHELREQLSTRDDLLSTLELERDLYKAEVTKLKDQLQHTQNERVFDAEGTESTPVHVTAIHGVDHSEPLGVLPEARLASMESVDSDDLVAPLVEHHSTFLGIYQRPRHDYSHSDVLLSQVKGKKDCKACFFVPRVLCRKKRRSVSGDGELGRLLQTSMDTNEELRKRIALLSAYYETVIERMQCSLNEAHTDRQRVATDLAKQIVSMDKDNRLAVEELERRLLQKDRELAMFREEL